MDWNSTPSNVNDGFHLDLLRLTKILLAKTNECQYDNSQYHPTIVGTFWNNTKGKRLLNKLTTKQTDNGTKETWHFCYTRNGKGEEICYRVSFPRQEDPEIIFENQMVTFLNNHSPCLQQQLKVNSDTQRSILWSPVLTTRLKVPNK